MATREEIQSKRTLRIEKVDIPEWGDDVHVRAMYSAELDDYELSLHEDVEVDGKPVRKCVNVRAKMVARTACNADGSRIFLDSDAEWLGRESCDIIDKAYDVAQRLSGRSSEEKALIEKNSESSQNTDSQ